MKNKSENTKKATNLILGAIYINGQTGDSRRLVNIIPCQGVWLEAYDGQGYGELVKFENVFYADSDEVQDFLDDLKIYNDCKKADKWNRKPNVDANAKVYATEENDGGFYGDEFLAHYDDDPSPYAGTYSEE